MIAIGFSPVGGLEIYTRDVAQGLVAAGHEVDVWSVLSAAEPLNGVRIEQLAPASRLQQSAQYRLLQYKVAARLRTRRHDFDLVLCMHPHLAVGTHRGLRRSDAPFWVWAHGTDIWGTWSPALRKALAAAQSIATVSQFTAASIRERMPHADVAVLFPTVGIDTFSADMTPSDLSRDPVLLTVSRLAENDAYKGHDRVIEALPLIEQALGRDVGYRIAGGGNGADRLRRIAQEHGVVDRVTFLGRVDHATLAEEYRRCDLFVMPSRMDPAPAGSMTGEGFGIVSIEAQAAGRPVVASNEAAAPETIREGKTGFAVNPRSPEAIADACARILALPDRGRSMGYAGWEFVQERFGREAFLERLSALLARR
jgi:glycosyltransferase involved in cell wall biosynthesis